MHINIHNDDGTFLKTQCSNATEYSGQTQVHFDGKMMVVVRKSRAHKNIVNYECDLRVTLLQLNRY